MPFQLRDGRRSAAIRLALLVPVMLLAPVVVLNWPVRWFRILNQTEQPLTIRVRAFDGAPWTDYCELAAGAQCTLYSSAATGEGQLSVDVGGHVVSCGAYASRSPFDLLVYPYEARVVQSLAGDVGCRGALLMPFPAMTPLR